MDKEKAIEFLKNNKIQIGSIVLIVLFLIGLIVVSSDNYNLRKGQKEYKKQIDALNDSISDLRKAYKLNIDTIYITEKEANNHKDAADNAHKKTDDVRNQMSHTIDSINRINNDSAVKLFSKFTKSYRFSSSTN